MTRDDGLSRVKANQLAQRQARALCRVFQGGHNLTGRPAPRHQRAGCVLVVVRVVGVERGVHASTVNAVIRIGVIGVNVSGFERHQTVALSVQVCSRECGGTADINHERYLILLFAPSRQNLRIRGHIQLRSEARLCARFRIRDGNDRLIHGAHTGGDGFLGNRAGSVHEHRVAFRAPRRFANVVDGVARVPRFDGKLLGFRLGGCRAERLVAHRHLTFQQRSGQLAELVAEVEDASAPNSIEAAVGRGVVLVDNLVLARHVLRRGFPAVAQPVVLDQIADFGAARFPFGDVGHNAVAVRVILHVEKLKRIVDCVDGGQLINAGIPVQRRFSAGAHQRQQSDDGSEQQQEKPFHRNPPFLLQPNLYTLSGRRRLHYLIRKLPSL